MDNSYLLGLGKYTCFSEKLQSEQQCEYQMDIIDLCLKLPPEILGILNYLSY